MNPGDLGGRGPHPKDPDCAFYKADHMPLPMPHEQQQTLYMLLDVTSQSGTCLLAKAAFREVQIMGTLAKANGRQVIAPPVAARGLSALTLEQLQFLFWNMTQTRPSDNFAELIQATFALVVAFPQDKTPLDQLQRMVAELPSADDAATPAPVVAAPKPIKAAAGNSERPKPDSVTGKVWTICDNVLNENGCSEGDANAFNWKALRAKIIAACEQAGINPATATTQFSKYKVARLKT